MYSSYSSPNYNKNYTTESSSSYYHNVTRDSSDPDLKSSNYSSSSTSKYTFGVPSPRVPFPFYEDDSDPLSSSNRFLDSSFDKINKYKSSYDKSSAYSQSYDASDTFYDKSFDKSFEKYDKSYDKSFDKTYKSSFDKKYFHKYESDDGIQKYSNTYLSDTDRQIPSPSLRTYASPPPTTQKRVHYDLNSSGSMNTSGRSGSYSPYEYTYTPEPDDNCPVHPYRSQRPMILHEYVGAPFRHLVSD